MNHVKDDDRLLLTALEAARALGISQRTLWTLTARGEIPCIKLGRLNRYPRAALEEWIAERTAQKRGGAA